MFCELYNYTICRVQIYQEGSSISRQNFNENLETLQLAPTLFYHYTWFLFLNNISKSSFVLDFYTTYRIQQHYEIKQNLFFGKSKILSFLEIFPNKELTTLVHLSLVKKYFNLMLEKESFLSTFILLWFIFNEKINSYLLLNIRNDIFHNIYYFYHKIIKLLIFYST